MSSLNELTFQFIFIERHHPTSKKEKVSFSFVSGPKATILGDSDVFMDVGSSLNLTCVVTNANARLMFIIWKHRNKVMFQFYVPYAIYRPL